MNLGYTHITRNEYITNHVSEFSNIIYNDNPEVQKAISIIDGTYIKIEKSRNFRVLRRSFSVHKHYHLLKPTLVCAPNGYILAVHGPYFSDSRNNDASTLVNEFNKDMADIRAWFSATDIFILDRGYRDAQEFLTGLGIQIEMPAPLGRRPQLTTQEANDARLITKSRYVVETRNGHLKSIFKIFKNTFPNALVPRLGQFLRIACALINRYHPTINPQTDTPERAEQMLARAQQPNMVQQRVENEGLFRRHGHWNTVADQDIPDFPVLDLDYLRDLTFGTFQIAMAPSYVQDNSEEYGDLAFEMDVSLAIPNFLRIRVKSRHRNAVKYQIAIQYSRAPNELVTGYYCTCRSGARTVGTCCHIASVLWFLGHARHENLIINPQDKVLHEIEDAANRDPLLPVIV